MFPVVAIAIVSDELPCQCCKIVGLVISLIGVSITMHAKIATGKKGITKEEFLKKQFEELEEALKNKQ
jgi:hypothetical protein